MAGSIGRIVAEQAGHLHINMTASQVAAFDLFGSEMKKWNSKFNLTSITRDNEIAVKHFVDSLSLIPFLSPENSLLDIGSGAGFPVIPLKIALPKMRMVSVDAVSKKILFQRHIIRTLGLEGLEAVHARVETLCPDRSRQFGVITSRAFSRLDLFIDLAEPLLTDDGTIIAMKGAAAEDDIYVSDEFLAAKGLLVSSRHSYILPYEMGERVLTFIKRRKPA